VVIRGKRYRLKDLDFPHSESTMMLQCPVLRTAINAWENEGGGLPPLTDAGLAPGLARFPPYKRVGHGRAYMRLDATPRTGAFQKESGEL
jgi:hypothetical protein